MFSEVKELFQKAKTEQEMLDVVQMLCEPYGTIVNTDVMWCTRPRQVMCVVEMPDMRSAHTVASRCGTITFGPRRVVFKCEASASLWHSKG